MSVSQLLVPNNLNLYCNSILSPSNQIYWNSRIALTDTNFIGPGSSVASFDAGCAVTNNALTINSMRITLSTAPTAGNGWSFVFYINDVATLLVVNITNTSVTNVNSVNTVHLNPGDKFAVRIAATGSPVAAFGSICLGFN